MKLPRALKWLLEGAFGVLSVAFALMLAFTSIVVVLTSSAWGLGWLLRAASFAGIEVEAHSLSGSLFGPIELGGLQVRLDDDTRIQMQHLSLRWNPGALWIGELRITRFAATDLRVTAAERRVGAPRQPDGPLSLGVHLVVEEAVADRFSIVNDTGAAPTAFTDVHLAGEYNGNRVRITDARAVLESYGAMQVSGAVELFRRSLRAQDLRIASPVSGVLSGTYQYAPERPSVLHAHVTSVAPYLRDTPLTQVTGDLDVSGRLGEFTFDARFRGLAAKVVLSATAHGKGSLRGLHFDALELRGPPPGSLLAHGEFGWHGGVSGDMGAELRHLDLSPFLAGEKSDLNGTATARSQGSGLARDIHFTARLDHSTLRGFAFALDTEGDYAGRALRVSRLQAEAAGHTHLTASGTLFPALDVTGDLDSADIGALGPDVGGSVALHATVSGSDAASWHVVTQGHLEAGHGFGYAAQHLAWDADIDWLHAWRLQAQADHLQAGLLLDHASVSVAGARTHQSIELAARGPQGEARVALVGALDVASRAWSGSLEQLRLAAARFPAVTLEAPAALALSAQRVSLGQACLTGDPGRLCLQASWQSGAVQAVWHVPGIALGALAPLLPPGWVLHGQLQGEGSLSMRAQALDDLRGNLMARIDEVQLPGAPALHGVSAQLQVVPAERDSLHARLDVALPQGRLRGELVSGAGATLRARPLSGTVTAQVADISWVGALFPEMQKLQGTLQANATLGGTLGEPTVRGDADLANGQVTLETAGVTLKQLAVKLHGDGSGRLHLVGRGNSEGPVAVEGEIDLGSTPMSMDLHITGTYVQALDRADARIWVTPDLHLLRDVEALRLTGSVGVPRAEITPKGGPSSGAQTASQDQVLIGRGVQRRSDSLPVRATVTISLGAGVHFKGYGLTSRLEGSVTVRDSAGQETRGTGELRLLEGRYKAYGQDLKIDAGRLIFNGGIISSPAIDIRASRQPTPQITVGVHVRGTLAAPEFALESEPAMSREDILGWLLLGQPLSQSSTDQKAAIQSTALSLGVMGSSWLGAGLTQKLGVNLSVTSENTAALQEYQAAGSNYGAPQPTLANGKALPQATAQSPQLTLGKYLSPRLFISYGVSVFQPGQTVNLQYDIGHGFKVQTETGTASGGDLLYTVEKGLKPKRGAADKREDDKPVPASTAP